LQRAQQLLSETDSKIIHVALESGYRHLGLFNATFKKYIGMAPSQWRRLQEKKKKMRSGRQIGIRSIATFR
jgi:AraC-like DNA-binding protein